MLLNLSIFLFGFRTLSYGLKDLLTPKLEGNSPTFSFSFCIASFYIKSFICLDSSKLYIVWYGSGLTFSHMTTIPIPFI